MDIDYRSIIWKIGRLHILHRLHIHKAATKNQLHFGQLPILETIITNDNCSQRELADKLQVSPPSIATSIKRMQKTGLLERIADENDMRYTHITITEKGKDLAEKCRIAFDEVDKQMFTGFNADECKQFYEYIERLINNLSTDEYIGKDIRSLIAEVSEFDIKQKKEDIDCD